jgi:hypothetical protein
MPPQVSAVDIEDPPVQRILSGHLHKLGGIPIFAWDMYWAHYDDEHHVHDKTTIANIIHCWMVRAAQEVCKQNDSLDYREQYHGMHVIIVEHEVVVRFKKLDENLRPSNVGTEIQERIERGEVSLFGDRVRGLVTVGYVPDEARTTYQGIHAVKHGRGKDPTWDVEIGEGEVAEYQIADLFGATQEESERSRHEREPATLKVKPEVDRPNESAEREGEPQNG